MHVISKHLFVLLTISKYVSSYVVQAMSKYKYRLQYNKVNAWGGGLHGADNVPPPHRGCASA